MEQNSGLTPAAATAQLATEIDGLAAVLSDLAGTLKRPHTSEELLQGLRTLSKVEVEADRMQAGVVAVVRAEGVIWDRIGKAAGVAEASAWRRWHSAALGAPRPTGQARPRLERGGFDHSL